MLHFQINYQVIHRHWIIHQLIKVQKLSETDIPQFKQIKREEIQSNEEKDLSKKVKCLE